ncbi:hypothetical protein FYJ83_01415 [Tissierella sp. DSM 105185]|uniref:Uncharacterized protein n=2 Tax=Tissierella pigra TaxID=2607614 RepID=A0A6N7XUG1_9FIRM|nr:YjfB family protein [Tissierella pigra]MSU00125.1 hypothetical protein [Tissierella pigra]
MKLVQEASISVLKMAMDTSQAWSYRFTTDARSKYKNNGAICKSTYR